MAEFFINFTRYIDEESPVKIRMIGETQQEDSVNEERKNSDIMALEYIISGEGRQDLLSQGRRRILFEKGQRPQIFFE